MTASALSPQFLAAVLSVLKSHVGRANAIGRSRLCAALAVIGFGEPSRVGGMLRVDERKVREAVAELQDRGELIGSTGGKGGGYFVLESREEYRWFEVHELNSRALTILHKRRRMRQAARAKWPGPQMALGL